ncbi:MAG: RidA family protein [Anaerolineae bacterium]|nr:RidA family protein [Chloroflexota bacterium]MBP6297789.1 RidA family protein [Anaerolineae bacterium]
MKKIIHTDEAPPAAGPYSQAVVANNVVYTAGQIGLNPQTRQFAGDSIQDQTRQVFSNLRAVLHAAGCDFGDVVKATVFLKDMTDFAAMNAIYGEYFAANPPARSTVQVARLPIDALIEIELIAVLP